MELSLTGPLARLTLAGLRNRLPAALLSMLVLAGAAAVIALALAVGRVADEPWQRTFEATRGSHVEAFAFGGAADPRALASMPGVAEAAPPWREALVSLKTGGRATGARLLAGPTPDGPLARPLVTAGRWLVPGAVVLERGFADALGLSPGDHLTIAGRRLRVAGLALSTSREPYPASGPGTVFAAPGDLEALAEPAALSTVQAVRLADPGRTAEFVAAAQRALGGVALIDWQHVKAAATSVNSSRRVALLSMTIFLLLSAASVIAVTVGARVLEREREIGILRSLGFAPAMVAALFVGEYVLLALLGAAVGFTVGALAAPMFTEPSAAVLGGSEVALGAGDAATVVAATVALAACAALLPSLRAVRRATSTALRGGGRAQPSRLAARLGELGLPLSVSLGASQATARRARAALTVISLGLSVVTVVATLSMEATFDAEARQHAAAPAATGPARPAGLPGPVGLPPEPAGTQDDADNLRPIVYPLGAALILFGLLNLMATSLLAVRERRRDHAILRTLGLSPRGVVASVAAAGGLQGALAAIVGIPLGIGFFQFAKALSDGGEGGAIPAAWSLALVVPGAIALAALAALGPAALAARQPPADALRHD